MILTLDDIANRIGAKNRPDGMTTAIIAIDGCGGSGKSTLAERLAGKLDCAIIHTDDFAEWDNPLDWYPRMIEQVLEPLCANRPAHYQRYDWGTKTLADWRDVPPAPHLIVEGVSALRAAFRPYLTFGIYVETPPAIRLRRGLERDGDHALSLWQSWMAEEDAYLIREAPADHADLVISGNPTADLDQGGVEIIM